MLAQGLSTLEFLFNPEAAPDEILASKFTGANQRRGKELRALKFQFVGLIAAMLLTGGIQLQAEQGTAPELNQILSRMEEARAKSKQTEPFLLTREYRMFHGDEKNPASEVKAEINVLPPNEREYRIVEAKGNDRGEAIVRKILDHEVQEAKSLRPPAAVVRDNYDFGFAGEEQLNGVRCFVLTLRPKRKDPVLVNGRVWVDANSYLVRKVEGEMAKSPSWWVKDVMLRVQFGEIGGVWTQTTSDAVANVRLIGKYTVNGRATSLQTANSVAANAAPVQKKIVQRRVSVPATVLYNGMVAR